MIRLIDYDRRTVYVAADEIASVGTDFHGKLVLVQLKQGKTPSVWPEFGHTAFAEVERIARAVEAELKVRSDG